MASAGVRKMLYLTKFVNTIDGTIVVYDATGGVHADGMANVRVLHAFAYVTQNLQGKIMFSMPLPTCKSPYTLKCTPLISV